MTITTHEDGTSPDWRDPNVVFVFGSNTNGAHRGGAARAAYEWFGAEWGKVEGPSGQTYAISTISYDPEIPEQEIEPQIVRFLHYVDANPDKQFFLTRIGCGIAGYDDEDIAPLFAEIRENISYPEIWAEIIEEMNVEYPE